jgi:hypothetical protein
VKARLVFYGGIVLTLALLVLYATAMPGRSYRGRLPEPSRDERTLEAALQGHVLALSRAIGERRIGRSNSLDEARDYILSVIRKDPSIRAEQVRLEDVGAEGFHAQNIVTEIPGTMGDLIVIGAHYDSAEDAPGADDNATGVAATLEIMRCVSSGHFHKTLRFVLFANEEPPYFQNAGMGSLTHARGCRDRGERVDAMLSLESIGYYADAPGTQQYPWPVGLLYPDRGDFLAFVGDFGSRALVRRAIRTFRTGTAFPSEGAALPASVPGVAWSDHWAFWEAGYDAIMITDTAPFRNPHYHETTDVAASVDYLKLARVTWGLTHVVEELVREH